MEGTMGNEGVNKLAGLLQGRMHSMSGKPQTLDIGTIQGDMSLITNRFPVPIPQSDYLVCRQLTLGATGAYLTETHVQVTGTHNHAGCGYGSGHSDGAHDHDVQIPEKMRSIKPGDRVLVAWVGDDPCVIDIVLPGSTV